MAKELNKEEFRKNWERLTHEQRGKLWRLVNGLAQKDPEVTVLAEQFHVGTLSAQELVNRL